MLFMVILVVSAATGIADAGVATAEDGRAGREGAGDEDELSNLDHGLSHCNGGAAGTSRSFLRARKAT
jgi:hypothetical protein